MSILAFQIPEKVVMEKADDFHGLFTFKPLEKGYGVTIGNALRRILLSSLEGYAITGIKVPGVLHEFSTIKGIKEDYVSKGRFMRCDDKVGKGKEGEVGRGRIRRKKVGGGKKEKERVKGVYKR